MPVKLNAKNQAAWPVGRLDAARLDATSERELAAQQASDDVSAKRDAAKYARRVRQRLGLTQQELSLRIEVSLETIRNWEQGKRSPTGAAKALLRVLDRAPEAALGALS
jgi:putative transcriptional regulator